jgi:hypothetical protein
MKIGIFAAALAAVCAFSAAWAHGGGYVAVPVFVGGPTPGLPPAETGDYSRIHTVAILSAIGQTLTMRTAGGAFGHGNDIDIRSWKLDDLSTSIASRYLSTRFTVKDVAFDRAGLAAIPNGTWVSSGKGVKSFLATVPNDGVDAFVLIRPDLEGYTGAYQIEGLGVQTSDTNYPPVEWLTFEIDIIDAHSLERIGKAFSRAQMREGTGAQLPGFLMPANRNIKSLAPTEVELSMLKTDFEFHLDNTMTETLRALNLGITLPEPALRKLIPVPEAMDPFKAGKSVAIVSAVGDTLALTWRGTLFRHDSHLMTIADWNMDGEIEAQIARSLDRHLSVKKAAFDRAKLSSARLTLDKDKHLAPIDGLTPSTDVDFYLVALKSRTTTSIGDSMTGFEVLKVLPFGGESTSVYASYDLAFVDAHTLKVLGAWRGVASPKHPSALLVRPVDNTVYAQDALTLSPEAQNTIHAAFSDIIADSIPETLLHLGLTGQMLEKPEAVEAGASAPGPISLATPAPSPGNAAAPANKR